MKSQAEEGNNLLNRQSCTLQHPILPPSSSIRQFFKMVVSNDPEMIQNPKTRSEENRDTASLHISLAFEGDRVLTKPSVRIHGKYVVDLALLQAVHRLS